MGATGYAGSEVLRLAASHPDLDIVLATGDSSVTKRVADHVPALAACYPELVVEESTRRLRARPRRGLLRAAPWRESGLRPTNWCDHGVQVVDLGADFRLRARRSTPQWYGHEHHAPQLLAQAVYGLVERHRDELVGPRSSQFRAATRRRARWPSDRSSMRASIEREQIVVNALSGVSGAGRATSERLHFSRLSGNAEAYGLLTHRHTPEMQQELGATLLFTPHLVPVSRGMLVSAYARLAAVGSRPRRAVAPSFDVRRRPLRRRDGRGTDAEGSPRQQPLFRQRAGRRAHGLAARDELARQPRQGCGRPGVQAWNVSTGRAETLGLPCAGVTP